MRSQRRLTTEVGQIFLDWKAAKVSHGGWINLPVLEESRRVLRLQSKKERNLSIDREDGRYTSLQRLVYHVLALLPTFLSRLYIEIHY